MFTSKNKYQAFSKALKEFCDSRVTKHALHQSKSFKSDCWREGAVSLTFSQTGQVEVSWLLCKHGALTAWMLPGSAVSYLEIYSGSGQWGKDHVPACPAAHLRSDLPFAKWGRLFVISLNERRSATMNWAFGSGLASTKIVQCMQKSKMRIF